MLAIDHLDDDQTKLVSIDDEIGAQIAIHLGVVVINELLVFLFFFIRPVATMVCQISTSLF